MSSIVQSLVGIPYMMMIFSNSVENLHRDHHRRYRSTYAENLDNELNDREGDLLHISEGLSSDDIPLHGEALRIHRLVNRHEPYLILRSEAKATLTDIKRWIGSELGKWNPDSLEIYQVLTVDINNSQHLAHIGYWCNQHVLHLDFPAIQDFAHEPW